MEQNREVMWKATIEELVDGFQEVKEGFTCIFCGKSFKKGRIYELDQTLFDAYGAVKHHREKDHGESVDYLLNLHSNVTGLSEVQQQILKLMSSGKGDKEIAAEVGIAQSTVRNHRFKLREKEKQAKIFLALMRSLEEKTSRSINETDCGVIEEIHSNATMVDDRYTITDQEREKTIKTYMTEEGAIKQYPSKEKKKIIILGEIMKNFVRGRDYSEAEVNKVLKRMYDDYPTLRRALIEYGFFDRSTDCKVYRVKE
ncbi:DUF2087 domain-containing protein [Anaerosporobacter faecicola]|uniref:DUF2087 domain-containing protein n=1 Tax=Anaerosporobacter faecicola TaxID=2718714 RepID=UPI00143B5C6F|nr:DUF2087 domain-containing protein [Anaerosporobacter faecicola]